MTKDSGLRSSDVSMWAGVKRKAGKVFSRLITIIMISAAIFIYWKYFYTYSDGYRAGLLQKFSHKGNIFKTYEGEMILSSILGNMNVTLASEKFYFSVTNPTLARELDTIQGRSVIVHYRQKNGRLFWNGESKYLVDSVKRMK